MLGGRGRRTVSQLGATFPTRRGYQLQGELSTLVLTVRTEQKSVRCSGIVGGGGRQAEMVVEFKELPRLLLNTAQ